MLVIIYRLTQKLRLKIANTTGKFLLPQKYVNALRSLFDKGHWLTTFTFLNVIKVSTIKPKCLNVQRQALNQI